MNPMPPTRVIALRMRELRTKRGWSAQELADQMVKVGIPWQRPVVANLETGRRRTVSVEELLALAYVFNVAPIHLLVPLRNDIAYRLTPSSWTTASARARE